MITDTMHGYAVMSATGPWHVRFTTDEVESQIERRTGAYPLGTRMQDLAALGTIALRRDR